MAATSGCVASAAADTEAVAHDAFVYSARLLDCLDADTLNSFYLSKSSRGRPEQGSGIIPFEAPPALRIPMPFITKDGPRVELSQIIVPPDGTGQPDVHHQSARLMLMLLTLDVKFPAEFVFSK